MIVAEADRRHAGDHSENVPVKIVGSSLRGRDQNFPETRQFRAGIGSFFMLYVEWR